MKLLRFGPADLEKTAVLLPDGRHLDVSAAFPDYDEKFFATDGLERLRAWLASPAAASAPLVPAGVRLGPPIARPSKIICIGLNYRDHAAESGMAEPAEPVVFFKSTSALTGPSDELVIPRGSLKTDWEVELAVVMGRTARYVSEAEALDCVAGYALHNDYSERAWQLERGGQWVKGKSADTFAPIGPWLVTRDEIADVGQLALTLSVNGRVFQNGNTRNLIFNVPFLISYLSQFMTLLPGDVISTGTPAGVGLGQKPPLYLKPGDVIELGIEGLGQQRQVARAFSI
ncbi:MAG: fumarylacetoacetate hydrolase family protein [Verrucomicrobia bacterium]|nr:fumarylacetoacetate hydrolase family protein [Verrucomicrobiota bacterium]